MERKEVILLTVVPVLLGLLVASVAAVQSGFVRLVYRLPLWIFYGVLIPAYIGGYLIALGIERDSTVRG